MFNMMLQKNEKKKKLYIQSTKYEGDASCIDSSTALAFIHHQTASIPRKKCPYCKRQPRTPHSQAFGDALFDSQLCRRVQYGCICLHNSLLGGERINRSDRAQSLLDDGVRLAVLLVRLPRQIEKVFTVDHSRYDQEKQRRKGH